MWRISWRRNRRRTLQDFWPSLVQNGTRRHKIMCICSNSCIAASIRQWCNPILESTDTALASGSYGFRKALGLLKGPAADDQIIHQYHQARCLQSTVLERGRSRRRRIRIQTVALLLQTVGYTIWNSHVSMSSALIQIICALYNLWNTCKIKRRKIKWEMEFDSSRNCGD